MKNIYIKLFLACLAGSAAFGIFWMPTQAANQASAGVSAVLNDSLVSDSSAGISTVLNQSLIAESNTSASAQNAQPKAKETKGGLICGYANLGIANVENHLNIREGAGEEYDLDGKLQVDAGCEILSREGEWCRIRSGEVNGFVKGEFLLTGEAAAQRAEEVKLTVATSNTQTLNARVEPSTDSTIWTTIAEGEELQVLEDMGAWVKVDVDGDACYVAREYVVMSEQLPKAMTMTEIQYGQGVSDVRVDMVQYACQFIGNRYVWGGTSLTNGVDCSGFVMRIYEKYGISLPHYSGAQAGYGTKIDASEARPGDLFFYGNGSGINHVAMYIGDGQVVHASSEKTGIKISNAFYRTPVCVTRLLND